MTTPTQTQTTANETRPSNRHRDELLESLKANHTADYASPLIRAAAAVIDVVILSFVCVITTAVLAGIFGNQSSNATSGAVTIGDALSSVVLVGMVLGYFPACWATWGQTPAMRIFGLRVCKADDLSPITVRIAVCRFLVLLAAGWLGCLLAFVEPRRQAFHDRITKTVVVTE